ncbi:MAG: energy transducer TonB [Candidatus Omnitrophica bacterium]|nr:energy transducer TonB [Candidatus Omnitrophota bacterium]
MKRSLFFFLSLFLHSSMLMAGTFYVVTAPTVEVTTGVTSFEMIYVEEAKSEETKEKAADPDPLVLKEEKKAEEKKEEKPKEAPAASHAQSEGVEWVEPRYQKNPPPVYPRRAVFRKEEGFVFLVVDLDERGLPLAVEVEKSSGFSLLDEAALRAVRRWRFVPAKRGNFYVKSRCRVPVSFKIVQIY